MPANLPYFPSRNADIAAWLLNFSTLLTASPTTYGLTAGNATTVAAQNTAWQAAYTDATNPATRTPVTVAALQSATFTMRAIVLPFATLIAGNPAVLDADKTAIGVTVRITTRTPVPPPASAPGFDLVNVTPLSATYRYYDLATPTSKKKPYGAVSVEVARSIGAAPAVDPDAAQIVAQVTKAPFSLPYSAGDVGDIATLWVRFRNRSGVSGISAAGPWSTAVSHAIV